MRRALASLFGVAAMAAFLACGGFGSDDPKSAPADAAAEGSSADVVQLADAAIAETSDGTDASSGPCTSDMPFVHLDVPEGINTPGGNEFGPRLTADELGMYLGLRTTTDEMQFFGRATTSEPWIAGQPRISDSSYEFTSPWISPDGKRLFYTRIALNETNTHIALAPIAGGVVGIPMIVAGLDDDSYPNRDAYLSPDESEIWFVSERGSTGFDLMHGLRSNNGGYVDLEPVAELNSSKEEATPVISADGHTIYYATDVDRAAGQFGIRMATRAGTDGVFSPALIPKGIESLQDGVSAQPAWISPDNCRLYLSTKKNGPSDIYIASRR